MVCSFVSTHVAFIVSQRYLQLATNTLIGSPFCFTSRHYESNTRSLSGYGKWRDRVFVAQVRALASHLVRGITQSRVRLNHGHFNASFQLGLLHMRFTSTFAHVFSRQDFSKSRHEERATSVCLSPGELARRQGATRRKATQFSSHTVAHWWQKRELRMSCRAAQCFSRA